MLSGTCSTMNHNLFANVDINGQDALDIDQLLTHDNGKCLPAVNNSMVSAN